MPPNSSSHVSVSLVHSKHSERETSRLNAASLGGGRTGYIGGRILGTVPGHVAACRSLPQREPFGLRLVERS